MPLLCFEIEGGDLFFTQPQFGQRERGYLWLAAFQALRWHGARCRFGWFRPVGYFVCFGRGRFRESRFGGRRFCLPLLCFEIEGGDLFFTQPQFGQRERGYLWLAAFQALRWHGARCRFGWFRPVGYFVCFGRGRFRESRFGGRRFCLPLLCFEIEGGDLFFTQPQFGQRERGYLWLAAFQALRWHGARCRFGWFRPVGYFVCFGRGRFRESRFGGRRFCLPLLCFEIEGGDLFFTQPQFGQRERGYLWLAAFQALRWHGARCRFGWFRPVGQSR